MHDREELGTHTGRRMRMIAAQRQLQRLCARCQADQYYRRQPATRTCIASTPEADADSVYVSTLIAPLAWGIVSRTAQ